MHISTANSFNTTLDTLIRRQADLNSAQEQLSTNKRVNRASDDPAAAARAERALAAQARTDASQRAVDASETAMTLSESALGDGVNLLQEARDAMVAAGNGSYTDAERKVQADKLLGIRQQLLAVANRQDASGNYVFGGQGSSQPPFLDAPGGVQFRGTAGQSEAASGEPLPLTIDGEQAWMRASTGNGVFATSASTSTGSAWIDTGHVTDPAALTGSSYSIQFSVAGGVTTYSVLKDGAGTAISGAPYKAGQAIEFDGMSTIIKGDPADADQFEITPSTNDLDVFAVLDKTIADLNTPSRSSAQIAQTNSSNLASLDSVMGQLIAARSAAGATLNRIDGVTGRLDAVRLAAQTDAENATGLDMAKAISEFQNMQTGYDAALKSYSMVQKLSLFNYLG
jgi:flagellar hook-associated protein 3 FlgL